MMKKTAWILGIALAGLVAMAGAGCNNEPPAPKMPTYQNVQVDTPKLRKTFETAGPDAQNALRGVNMGLRYGKYVDSLAALDKLKELPGLTDAQKQVIDEVAGQITQAAKNQEAAKAAQ
ncbi:MAG: hypothetical protein ABSH34_36305 [Verrucomicrobiota bacterium]|jgi:hypothetical protein